MDDEVSSGRIPATANGDIATSHWAGIHNVPAGRWNSRHTDRRR
jgi:hypothetical protein